ncbi:aquaporin-like protein [Stachybotrys elegans]|uniref:Aquaporin-like protein n=1 Tax=Stachybotrys elegans TaxID=80388 RepID=A0A8K0WSC0_9HYPO|nr:aquaporin-like protein [Stachybotrys elegans]
MERKVPPHQGPRHHDESDVENRAAIGGFEQMDARHEESLQVDIPHFAGRLGAQGTTAVSRSASNEDLLKYTPDAAPLMSFHDILDLQPFFTVGLWKSALMEGVGTLMAVWLSSYASISPHSIPEEPTPRWGVFNNATFIGPLVGGFINFIYLTIFTFTFGAVSGAHLNPTITMATFFARLCSLPRAVLYGTRDFKVGGCWLYTEIVPVSDAFAVEFMASLVLLFFAFGVGIDPRQRQTIGPTLAPFMVGLTGFCVSFGTGFSRYGYGGACLNPARCLGVYTGSYFPAFHWYHWTADIAACAIHGVFYALVPPWKAHR